VHVLDAVHVDAEYAVSVVAVADGADVDAEAVLTDIKSIIRFSSQKKNKLQKEY